MEPTLLTDWGAEPWNAVAAAKVVAATAMETVFMVSIGKYLLLRIMNNETLHGHCLVLCIVASAVACQQEDRQSARDVVDLGRKQTHHLISTSEHRLG